MQILVIAATKAEIGPFLAANSKTDVLITGVGVPSTIYNLQKRTGCADYDLVIQAGIAGSFDTELPLGRTILVKQDCFADLGIEENGNYTPIFNTEFVNKDKFPFQNGWLINSTEYLLNSNLETGKAITVNKVSDSKLQRQQFITQFHADIETMEGAALHFVCLQENIPFIQIRSVSNYVGERDKIKWIIGEAIKNLNEELFILINKLKDN